MQWQRYNDVTEPRRGEPYRSGRFSMQQLELMQNNRGSRSGSKPDREPFITIDDLVRKAQELSLGLRKLSEYISLVDAKS